MVFSEERSMPKAAPAVFDMTLKSFDVQAINLKRGFQVKQALGGLRTLGMLARELDLPSQDDLTTTGLKPAKRPK